MEHHKYINSNKVGWHWTNLFLINDNVKSTADLWITDILPTLVFCLITGQWWIAIFMYAWTAFIQESIEHNSKFNLPILSSGKWHLMHHDNAKVNFGFLLPLWDIIFRTYTPIK
jgi:sterol desaturase/sphingolipid hydroxylase (fatty acid hydroxylase superfamily)